MEMERQNTVHRYKIFVMRVSCLELLFENAYIGFGQRYAYLGFL